MNTSVDFPVRGGRVFRRGIAAMLTAGIVAGLAACATEVTPPSAPLHRIASNAGVAPSGNTFVPAVCMAQALERMRDSHRTSPIAGTGRAHRALPERNAGRPADHTEEAVLREQVE